MCRRRAFPLLQPERGMIVTHAGAGYETAVPIVNLGEVSIGNRSKPATDAVINPAMRGGLMPSIAMLNSEYRPYIAARRASYDVVLLTPAVRPPAAPMGASPRRTW
jgi:hypothetical protein